MAGRWCWRIIPEWYSGVRRFESSLRINLYLGDYMELFGKYLQGLSVMLSIDIVSSCFLAVLVMAVIVAVFSLLRG